MKIFVIGQSTLHWGRLEYGNVGNYYITETTFRELHRVFPGAEIVTTFQMTEQFQLRENVRVVPMDYFYAWRDDDLDKALKEYAIAELYSRTKVLAEETGFIREAVSSDLVVDFSGEMWGYHANQVGPNRFLVGLLKDRTAQLLGKKTVLLAGSQGPFTDDLTSKLAKEVFDGFDLILNREAETSKVLAKYGFDVSKIEVYACPAFLFEAAGDDEIRDILEAEKIKVPGRRTVGMVVCGFNMLVGPFDKNPRDDEDFVPFAETVEHIVNDLGGRVVLMSHSNGFELPPNFRLINGRDYRIVKQLYDVVMKRGIVKNPEDVLCISRPYIPKITKGIIRNFDMFVTGRLHASVAALSQNVPTVVIMHGHGPKSHKIIGFAEIVQNSEYIAYPQIPGSLIEKVDLCWKTLEKGEYRRHLEERIPEVKRIAHSQYDRIASLFG